MTCVLCSACYWLGHFWSRGIMRLVPDSWERGGPAIAVPYFTLMRWSRVLNDRGNCNVWGEPNE